MMKKKDFDCSGIRELTSKELQTNAGFFTTAGKFIGIIILGGLTGELIKEGWQQCKYDFMQGWNSV